MVDVSLRYVDGVLIAVRILKITSLDNESLSMTEDSQRAFIEEMFRTHALEPSMESTPSLIHESDYA